MSYTLSVGSDGTATTAQVVWSVNGQTYRFRSDNNFLAWITTIFEVADALNIVGGLDLLLTDQIPPVAGGTGNIYAKYDTAGSVAGNARGLGAVDFQQYRALATQVASGYYATVGGGYSNTASGYSASVGGGVSNTASGYYATVGGGANNDASDDNATVGGGTGNIASGFLATIGGGGNNTASGNRATVGGGVSNTASGYYATVGGGYSNTASGDRSTVGGGYSNDASGYYATVGGGQSNTASGYYATVGGGRNNTASAFYATVGGGYSNNASGIQSTVGGGYSNTSSADSGTVGGGRNNTASAFYATVGGGRDGLADRYGMFAHASGVFSAQGDAQAVEFVLRNTTSGVTPAVLYLDGTSNRLTIRNNTQLSGICTISGIKSDGSELALFQRSLVIKNIGGTTTLVHVSTISTDHKDDAAWALAITADNANSALQIQCTGNTGDDVRWVAVLRGLEIAIG